MKRVYIYLLISLIFFTVGCFNNAIILPENISELCDYKWEVIQEISEPDCFLFLDNGIKYLKLGDIEFIGTKLRK